jgi:hypothetical protein
MRVLNLDSQRFSRNTWVVYVAVAVCIVSSALSIFAVSRLNGIVHGELYNYGLQFSLDWATPYWRLEDFIYIILVFSSTFAGAAVIWDIWSSHKHSRSARVEIKHKAQSKSMKETRAKSTGIFCPGCKRNLTKPLTMLGSKNGQSRLISICPYCNTVLGEAVNKNDVIVGLSEEPVKH